MSSITYSGSTTLKLKYANDHPIPQIQLGVWESYGNECQQAVTWALEAGYRGIDSAEWYENEGECGAAIKSFLEQHTDVKRSDIFFTTKLRENVSYEATRASIKKSLKDSGLEYIDMYLLHAPYGGQKIREACYKAILDAVDDGEVKVAGVSNFGITHLQQLSATFPNRLPAVNQIELHPWNAQPTLVKFCQENSILLEAYSPLVKGLQFTDETVQYIAKKHNVSPAQVLIRWSLQRGFIVLPKSVTKKRIEDNLSGVNGWELEKEDVEKLDALDEHLVTDWDPTTCE